MLRITARLAEPADARRFLEIAGRAFSEYPEHARPKDTLEFVEHTHGPANPSGRAWVAVGEEEGRVVAHVSVIPFRFLRRDRTSILGWQVSCYAVDLPLQGRGVGHALLAELLRAVGSARPGDFVYTFPSPRSWPRFLKVGGREIAAVPARIAVPRWSRSGTVRDGQGAAWRVREVDAATARAELERHEDIEPRPGAFVRDKAYFRWRFLAEPSARRYRFAIGEREGSPERLLLALAEHSIYGQRLAILADGHPDLLGSRLGSAVAVARGIAGRRLVYLTTNVRWRGPPFAFRVPRRLDPRPVATFLMPGCDGIERDLAGAPILTGDWMSF